MGKGNLSIENKRATFLLMLLFIALYLGDFFFSICSIMGLNFYENEAHKVPAFMYSYVIFDIIVLLAYIKSIRKRGITKIDAFSYILITFIIIMYIFDPPLWSEGTIIFKSFIAKCIPAVFIASIIAKEYKLEDLTRNFDILVCIVSVGLIANFPQYISGQATLAGASYQALAYISALAYSMNFFLIVAKDKVDRFPLFETKYYRWISYLFLAIQVISCLISGGRGGAIFIIVSTLFVFTHYLKAKLPILIFFVVLSIIFIYVISDILPEQYQGLIQKGFSRSFSYLSSTGIDMTQTSNRDIVYSKSLNSIYLQPFLGYGLFKYIDVNRFYPHNFFLEILMQGGVLYLLLISAFLMYLVRKYFHLKRTDSSYVVLGLIALYPIVNLMFSGSYISTPLFWFSIFYILQSKVMRVYNMRSTRNL